MPTGSLPAARMIALRWCGCITPIGRRSRSSRPASISTRFYPGSQLESRLKLGLDTERRLILFVGRIEPLKGIDTLLESIALMDKDENCTLGSECLSVVIVGGDASVPVEEMTAEMQRLHALRDTLGLQKLVAFQGKQGQDTLADYYRAADVLVMPSHYESFGMAALEAMACGTPVVASRVGGLTYSVRDGETGCWCRSDPRVGHALSGC